MTEVSPRHRGWAIHRTVHGFGIRRYGPAKVWRWIGMKLYVLGAVSGGCMAWGGEFGRYYEIYFDLCGRPYRFGIPKEWWRCLLKGRHLRGEPIFMGLCSKCLRCEECGSEPSHDDPNPHAIACPQFDPEFA